MMPISFLWGSAFGRRMTSPSVFVSNRYCLSPPKAGPNWRVRLLVSMSAFEALGSAVAFYLWGNRRLNPANLVCNMSFPFVFLLNITLHSSTLIGTCFKRQSKEKDRMDNSTALTGLVLGHFINSIETQ